MTERPPVHLKIFPTGQTLAAAEGSLLMGVLRKAGIEITTPCNGQGLCGKCKVRITHAAPPVGAAAHNHLGKEEIAAGTRLACEVKIVDGMEVHLPEDHALDTRILEGERIRQSRVAPAAVVQKIDGQFRLCYQDRPPVALPEWQEDFSPKGLAVDLGTTTLVMTLMDLPSGRELATASAVNPQVRLGHDVMTRIRHGSNPEGLEELAGVIARGLNDLIGKVCRAARSRPREILDVVLGGNTTMLQLAAAIDPAPLGKLPFTVGVKSGHAYPAEQFGLGVNSRARFYVPPVAHAFVGSDISAGLLCIDFFQQDAPLLFMDLGTNGEMALTANGRRMVTSTAAGPAFEGMGITHGMRAAAGAIETVWTNGRYLTLRTIDGAPAKGICGSGIMDMMACLIRLGAVDMGGRLQNLKTDGLPRGPLSERHTVVDGVEALRLSDAVCFTQKDIRQFQLAKSAIQTGAEMLLTAAGMEAGELEKIVVAGAFGYHLRQESLRAIGILPRGFEGKIEFAGNTSRTGCALLLTDVNSRLWLEEQMRQVVHLAIAEDPGFQDQFIKNLSLGGGRQDEDSRRV